VLTELVDLKQQNVHTCSCNNAEVKYGAIAALNSIDGGTGCSSNIKNSVAVTLLNQATVITTDAEETTHVDHTISYTNWHKHNVIMDGMTESNAAGRPKKNS
jgi:hypothetical protein